MKIILIFCLTVIVYRVSAESRGAVDLSYSCVRSETTRNDLSPILLMHGLMGNKHIWKGIYEVLALQTNRMVCMSDARGHGLSPITEKFSFDLMAEDTVRLLDKLNISKAILVGSSMGGKTAAITALNYPHRVQKIVVEDMRPITVTPNARFMVSFFVRTLKNSQEAIPEGATYEEAMEALIKFFESAFKETLKLDMDENVKDLLKYLLVCNNNKCSFSMNMDFALKVVEDPEFEKSREGVYKGDALFIYGKSSEFKVGEAEDEILRLFPNAQLFGIEGAGHGVSRDKPQEYLSVVIKFINSS